MEFNSHKFLPPCFHLYFPSFAHAHPETHQTAPIKHLTPPRFSKQPPACWPPSLLMKNQNSRPVCSVLGPHYLFAINNVCPQNKSGSNEAKEALCIPVITDDRKLAQNWEEISWERWTLLGYRVIKACCNGWPMHWIANEIHCQHLTIFLHIIDSLLQP